MLFIYIFSIFIKKIIIKIRIQGYNIIVYNFFKEPNSIKNYELPFNLKISHKQVGKNLINFILLHV